MLLYMGEASDRWRLEKNLIVMDLVYIFEWISLVPFISFLIFVRFEIASSSF